MEACVLDNFMTASRNRNIPHSIGWRDRFGPPGLVVAAVLLVFSTLLPRGCSQLPAPRSGELHGDVIIHLWQYFWLDRFFEGGVSLFRTDMLFFPAHVDLTTLWEGHLDLLVAAPLVGVLGVIPTFNVVAFLFLLGAGLCIWRLASGVTGDPWAASLAACLFVLSPPVLHELSEGRSDVLTTALIALALFHGRAHVLEGRWRDLGFAALFTLLACVGYLSLGPMLLLLVPALLLGALPLVRRAQRDGGHDWCHRAVLLRRVGVLLGVLVLVGLPLLLLSVRTLGTELLLGPLTGTSMASERGVEWLAMSQHNGHGLRSVLLPWLLTDFGNYPGLGFLLLGFAGLGALWRGRRLTALPWVLAAIVFVGMSFGASLQMGQDGLSAPLPYRMLPWVLPYFLLAHQPYRCLVLGALALAVLAAFGIAALRRRWKKPPAWQLVVAVALPLLAAAQAYQYVPLRSVQVPQLGKAYSWLAQDDPSGVVVAIHRAEGHHWNELEVSPLLAQIGHKAPVCCLSLPPSLQPPELRETLRKVPFLAMLTGPIADIQGFRLPPGDPGDHGFSHLVLYVAAPRDQSEEQYARMLEASRGKVGIGPCSACDHLEERFGPPQIIEELEHSHLSVFRISDAARQR